MIFLRKNIKKLVGRSLKFFFVLLFVIVFDSNVVSATTVPNDAQVLNMVWRHSLGGNLYKTTTETNDINSLDPCIYYLPRYAYSSAIPLYRLYNGSRYMDSQSTSEGGYNNDVTIGRLFPTQLLGTELVSRYYNSALNGHTIIRSGETISGYTSQESFGKYGYRMYDANNLLSLTGGSVTIKSNKNAGGALWSWIWNNNEFINNEWDFGRQMQSAIFKSNYSDSSGTYNINPTEAGSKDSIYTTPDNQRQGSPCYTAYNSNSTQVTRSIPLEFNTEGVGGSTQNPVIWPGYSLGKNITLNYLNRSSLASYETHVTIPHSYFTATTPVTVEIPTGYLLDRFSSFMKYDAQTKTRTQVSPDSSGLDVTPSSGYGGVIIYDAGADAAMGIYATTRNVGGSISSLKVFRYETTDNSLKSKYNTSKFSACYSGALGKGESTFTVYIMTGTVDNCIQNMDYLYSSGVIGAPVVK